MEIAILLAVAVAAMWFMSSRTRKQQKEQVAFRDLLEPGQYVMTGSGMFGTVVDVEADAVTIESSPGVTSRWLKIAIAKLAEPPVASEDGLAEEYDEDEYDEDEYDEDETYDDAVEEEPEAGDELTEAEEPQDEVLADGPEAQTPVSDGGEDVEPDTDQGGTRR